MSLYDPPEPPEADHPCRTCDREMVKEWPSARDSEYICKNPRCPDSPYYKGNEPDTVWCRNCETWVNKREGKVWTGDDMRHLLCPGCDDDLEEPIPME